MIGYLGPAGTFTEAALCQYQAAHSLVDECQPYTRISRLFSALQQHDVSQIFVPIENSQGGDVYAVFEGLCELPKPYYITAEATLIIKQTLMAKQSTLTFGDIISVYGHEQSIRQCAQFLDQHVPQAALKFTSSNTVAAQTVLEHDGPVACLGFSGAANRYNLSILKENINDSRHNQTRFIVISSQQTHATGSDKSSFVFSTPKDQPGSLVTCLHVFADAGINLTRISSRPAQRELGEYLFFVDCVGHCKDPLVQACLKEVETASLYYKFLGSYPRSMH